MQRNTFPKKEHLLKRWEFQRVFQQKNKFIGNFFVIHILYKQPETKMGIIVTRRIGNAVIRNRAKRLIREAYRLNKKSFNDNIHLVVSIKPDIKGLQYKDVEEDFLETCKKAKVL